MSFRKARDGWRSSAGPGKAPLWRCSCCKNVTPEIPQSGSVETILLIDDLDEWADLFSDLLKGTKVKVIRSADLKNLPPADLVLLDEHINSLPILEVLDALSQAELNSKTVVVTAAINPERVTQFLRGGIKDVTLKPYTGKEVSEFLIYK